MTFSVIDLMDEKTDSQLVEELAHVNGMARDAEDCGEDASELYDVAHDIRTELLNRDPHNTQMSASEADFMNYLNS